MKVPRVALFADSYDQVNGAAMTLRRLVDYAEAHEFPFICFFDTEKKKETHRGSVIEFPVRHSFLSIDLDKGLNFDPLFLRHFRRVARELERFRPDLIHITGVNDISILGVLLSEKFDLPMMATWHTNVHEFGSRRLVKHLWFMPKRTRARIGEFVEKKIFDWAMLYHKIPQLTLAPNPEIVEQLEKRTGRAAGLMERGVDCEAFDTAFRNVDDGIFRFGYVGRLQAEKNVRLLAEVARGVPFELKDKVRFLIVGDGAELGFLRENIPNAELPGFLRGRDLAAAYANIDVFLFPSETDAFGNVVLEANASGVPAVVLDKGGPKFLVRHGVNGMVAHSFNEFVEHAIALLRSPSLVKEMKRRSREIAIERSWDQIFRGVYSAYEECLEIRRSSRARAAASGSVPAEIPRPTR
ncbi:MAG: glycosyltransferase [Acidobacteriota bacterium]|nr:MAG: glycosyltransferase [Acidobacteriota bacterium]